MLGEGDCWYDDHRQLQGREMPGERVVRELMKIELFGLNEDRGVDVGGGLGCDGDVFDGF